MDAEKLCNMVPELSQGLHHLTHDGIGILLAIDKLLQLPVAALATELCQSFIGYLVIGLQMGVVLDDIVPDLRGVLHHPDDILPLLGIALTQHLSPQVGVLMKRSLSSSNTRVNIDSAIMHEAISLMCSTTEEHRLTLQDILLHLLGDLDTMQGNTITGILTLKGWNIHILYMNTPLLTILIHEAGQHLIIEGLHAITTDAEVVTLKNTLFKNLRGKILTDEL